MTSLAIDFGTSRTSLASNGAVLRMRVPGAKDQTSSPSVLAIDETGKFVFGEPARVIRRRDPAQAIASAKRLIGRPFDSPEAAHHRAQSPVPLVAIGDGVGYVIGDRTLTVGEVTTLLITDVTQRANIDPGAHAAICVVPAAFDRVALDALVASILGVGFRSVQTIDAPMAAASACVARTTFRHALMYSLGAGFFDAAIVTRKDDGAPDVLACEGLAAIGGDDVDVALAEVAAERVRRESSWDLQRDVHAFSRLLVEVERAKLRLGFDERTTIDLASVDREAPTQVSSTTIDRKLLEAAMQPMVDLTFACCDRLLEKAKLTVSDLDALFVLGSASAVPTLRTQLMQRFGCPPSREVDPSHAMVLGADLALRNDISYLLGRPNSR